ncbi:MarR family winged helix-turn-helix transcriptional regulator [Sutcliffiella sp. NC1]|uniref:MarR family winged helix-turn-helix transcriptional regulator n=1 Tax=Sutcliffiella sp. NC1 TaxID=3004096 RepID=UPI0022DD9D09|nr:MarR family transcriptional regulator [Sutcliffiella sp. NC1]WBL13438.1 MarR family transcriptional regulator [Sutcliffiella sp. NC1]
MEDFLTLENQLCFAIYETANEFIKLYTKVLKPYDMTYPQYLVLLALWEKDGITLKQLGQKLNLGTGTLTPMIKRMVDKGWLEKVRSEVDERNVYIFLQEKAITQKKIITTQVANEIQLCNISMEEYNELMKQLKTLQTKINTRS